MKISEVSVNPVPDKVGFKSNQKENKNPIKNLDSDEKKILTGLAGLAVIGAAAVTTSVLKKKGTSPLKLLGNSLSNLTERFSGKPDKDPLIELLDGKRDKEAVELYKAYRAKEKMKSLQTKMLAGEFNRKPEHVFKNICEAQIKYRREAAIVPENFR